MDYKKYSELKQKGLMKLSKINNSYAVEIKKFSADTGEIADPIIEAIDIGILQKRAIELSAEIDAVNKLIIDCQALG